LGSSGASGHNDEGIGGGLEELSEDISLFLAGADVWVVLGNVLDDLFLLFELDGEVPDGSESLPGVGSSGKDSASKGVKSLKEVEAKVSSHTSNNTLDEETSSVGHLTGSGLPTIWGHWDGGSFAVIRDCGSALFEHVSHLISCLCLINKL